MSMSMTETGFLRELEDVELGQLGLGGHLVGTRSQLLVAFGEDTDAVGIVPAASCELEDGVPFEGLLIAVELKAVVA